MEFSRTKIPDVILIQLELKGDHRGFFLETYHAERYSEIGIPANFHQDNLVGSRRGTLRGLHYQIRFPQGKLIWVVKGEIYDVAVDIRRSSPTFGKWIGEWLTESNRRQLWVPPGFAHGYFVKSEWAEVVYKVTDIYAPEWERTINWNDPSIGIEWPTIPQAKPLLSEKDLLGDPLEDAELYE